MLTNNTLAALASNLLREPDDYMHSFRENVRMYLDEKNITLAEVAERADISESTLKSFVYGHSEDCHLSTAIKLAKVFKISIDELVGCGTLPQVTTESIQIVRQLPECYAQFVRWAIRMHRDMLDNNPSMCRAIEVMTPEIGPYGNLKFTYNLELMDISDLNEDLRPKISMGIRMIDNQFSPYYQKNDILLLANDRSAFPGEIEVKCSNDNLWILRYKKLPNGEHKYCSIREGVVAPPPEELRMTFGYVVKVVRSMKPLDEY